MPSTVWILAAVALTAVVGLTAVMLWWGGHRRTSHRLPQDWPLMQRPVFSWEERALYRQLRAALPHHSVLAKLPLVRFCQPIERQDLRYWFELLGPIHVSFVVCASNGRALAAIDIDRPERQVSERTLAIKQAVLEACHIRYVKCRSDQLPSIAELQLLVPSQGEQARPQVPSPYADTPQQSTLAHSVRTPRRNAGQERWKESGFASDSFFAPDGTLDERPSEFPPSGSLYDDTPAKAASPRSNVSATNAARAAMAAPVQQTPAAAAAAPTLRVTPTGTLPFAPPPARRDARIDADQQALREELRRGIRQDLRLEPEPPRRAPPVAAPKPAPLDLRLDPLLKRPPASVRPTEPRGADTQRTSAMLPGEFGPNIMPLHRTGPGPASVAGTLAEDMIGRDFGDAIPTPVRPRPAMRAADATGPGPGGAADHRSNRR